MMALPDTARPAPNNADSTAWIECQPPAGPGCGLMDLGSSSSFMTASFASVRAGVRGPDNESVSPPIRGG